MKTVFELIEANGLTLHGDIEHFAELIRADEREACAKVCDDLDDDLPDGLAGWQYGEAIRARSNT